VPLYSSLQEGKEKGAGKRQRHKERHRGINLSFSNKLLGTNYRVHTLQHNLI
jgi:hypothetical protein